MKNEWEFGESDDEHAAPEPASSVIPLRENESGGIEVYMTRRQENLSVLGGYYVFPGGKVDKDDYCDSSCGMCNGEGARKAVEILGGNVEPALAMGHWTAGLRELFEETGILLAYDENRSIPDFNDKSVRQKYDLYRKEIQNGNLRFWQMVKRENLNPATDKLTHFSHFITPPGKWRRFDVHFFLTVVPEVQRPRFHVAEISEGVWLTPSEALRKVYGGDWKMLPPTIYNLLNIEKREKLGTLVPMSRKTSGGSERIE